ncbi:MAG: sulfur carrier protein ThiS [Solirubrobacterales bacterium]|nr:sulfur carrier protein ThiS [Solirubrobacterales bacterium]
MQVLINGKARDLRPGATLADAVALLPGAPGGRGVAAAMDGEVVPRTSWAKTELTDGVRVEIVVAVQGG